MPAPSAYAARARSSVRYVPRIGGWLGMRERYGGSILPAMSDAPRAQLIHIDVDRRLGHEWDEWDGKPLPNRGDYDSPPALFFAWSAGAMVVGVGVVALALFLLGP